MTSAITSARRLHPAVEPGTGLAVARRGIGAELSKSLRGAWAARMGMMVELPLFFVAYFGILIFVGRGELPERLLATTLIGYVAAIFFHQQIARMFWSVLGEIQTGTIEQLYLSPAPSRVLMLGREISATLESVVVAAMLAPPIAIVAALIADLGFHLGVDVIVRSLVPIATMAVGTAGFSLIVAGLTVLWKRVELLVQLIFGAMFVFGGVLVSLDSLPGWMEVSGRLLFPISQPIEYLREILLEGRSLADARVAWGLGWLLAQPAVLLVTGGLVLWIGERIALRNGSLARY